jgi:hypothetical protein
MSWNSRSKLNFAQCFKQIHTHTHTRVYSQKKKLFKPYPEGYPVEWWMMHLFSCEYTSLELNFCYPSLNLGCGYFLGKAQHPRTPPHPVLEVSCILSKVLSFYLCCSPSWSVLLVRKPIRCSTSLIPKGVLHTFAPLPKPERPGFTPDRVTWGSLGGDQIPLLTPKGRTII